MNKQMTPTEAWKAVVGFDGLYEVSSVGRVRSLPRNTTRGKIRSLSNHTFGYPQVLLSKHSVKTMALVHHLVLKAFVGPKPGGMMCRHLDGNPKNNSATNLKWGTDVENKRDMIEHGTAMHGEKNGNSKLCELDVWLIRNIKSSHKLMAEFFGISDVTIGKIRTRKAWAHVED